VLVLALDEALLVAVLPLVVVDDEPDEEHAARPRAAATAATPTVVTRCLRPNGISGTPFRFWVFPRPREQPPQPVGEQTEVCQYSLSAPMERAGKP
jgi:hypothetical protein